jgi:hypothetical protein
MSHQAEVWVRVTSHEHRRILNNPLNTNSYLKALPTEKPYNDLKSAYSRCYSWTQVQQLFNGIYVGTYLWKDTLENPKMNALYTTIYVYTLM